MLDDDELKSLLNPLRKIEPDALQLKRWKKNFDLHRNDHPRKALSFWYALAAGFFVGAMAATLYFRISSLVPAEKNSSLNATSEWVTINTD